jgi:hypothetical protein
LACFRNFLASVLVVLAKLLVHSQLLNCVWNCHYHVALVVSLSSIGSRFSLWQLWQVMMHQLRVKCFFSAKGGEH